VRSLTDIWNLTNMYTNLELFDTSLLIIITISSTLEGYFLLKEHLIFKPKKKRRRRRRNKKAKVRQLRVVKEEEA